jgi:transcriptional regulator with XRE-family HTH domain
MTIQNRLKQIIKSKRLKITEFANICDIPYRSVQGYLYGERMLGGNAIIKICAQLNVNPNWLLMGKGEMCEEKPIQKEKTTQFESELFLNWLNEWWGKTDEKHRNWLEIQIKQCFPEYAEWLALKEKLDQEKSRH